jgi:hypothetical protein
MNLRISTRRYTKYYYSLTCPHPYYFSDLMKFVRPYNYISTERCVFKFSERPTAPENTDNTTFTLCSVNPHDFLKFKSTALFLRLSKCVLFMPAQLS